MPHKEDVAWWRPLFLIALMPIGVLGNVEGQLLSNSGLGLAHLGFMMSGLVGNLRMHTKGSVEEDFMWFELV